MSSGPGRLQKSILNSLEGVPFFYYNQLRWKIAFEWNSVERTESISPYIESGVISRSFKQNFLRAVNSLSNKRIKLTKERIVTVDDAFSYFPFHTDRLEVYQLRDRLLPSVKKYIIENNPRQFGNIEIEEKQAADLKKIKNYKEITSKWIDIENKILSILNSTNNSFEIWLEVLVRGRQLFVSETIRHNKSLVTLCSNLRDNQLNEIETITVTDLNALIRVAFEINQWKLGKMKAVLYAIANLEQYYRDRLKPEVKDFLLKENEDLIKSLPGHKEPRTTMGSRGISWGHLEERKYSDLMDLIITKQILRKQKIISLN